MPGSIAHTVTCSYSCALVSYSCTCTIVTFAELAGPIKVDLKQSLTKEW